MGRSQKRVDRFRAIDSVAFSSSRLAALCTHHQCDPFALTVVCFSLPLFLSLPRTRKWSSRCGRGNFCRFDNIIKGSNDFVSEIGEKRNKIDDLLPF
jgi:hypothetical protein